VQLACACAPARSCILRVNETAILSLLSRLMMIKLSSTNFCSSKSDAPQRHACSGNGNSRFYSSSYDLMRNTCYHTLLLLREALEHRAFCKIC
jgi:hypothetical protein